MDRTIERANRALSALVSALLVVSLTFGLAPTQALAAELQATITFPAAAVTGKSVAFTGGTVAVDRDAYYVGDTVWLSLDSADEGYAFAGWTVSGDVEPASGLVAAASSSDLVGTGITASFKLTGTSASVVALFQLQDHEVTFDSDGGAFDPSVAGYNADDPSKVVQQVEHGSLAAAPTPNPRKYGWTFVEWRASGASSAYDFSTGVTGPLTLVASWTLDMSAITSAVAAANSAIAAVGTGAVGLATLQKAISDAQGAVPTTPADVSAVANTLNDATAAFVAANERFTVTFDTVGGESVPMQSVVKDGYATEPDPAPMNGSARFDGWFAPGATTAFDFGNTPITASIELTAHWTHPTYITFVGVTASDGVATFQHGKVTGVPEVCYEGDVITLTAVPDEGYQIADPCWTITGDVAEVTAQSDLSVATGSIVSSDQTVSFEVTGTSISVQAEFEEAPAGATADKADLSAAIAEAEAAAWGNKGTEAQAALRAAIDSAREVEADEGATQAEVDAAAAAVREAKAAFDASPDYVTVSFVSAGSNPWTVLVETGGTMEAPVPPAYAGHVFRGWKENATSAEEYFDFSQPIMYNTALIADWMEVQETGADGSGSGSDGSGSDGSGDSGATGAYNVFRVYNPATGEHHYTADAYEREVLLASGWNDEQVAWISAAPSAGDPVWRVYNTRTGEHHYTADAYERSVLLGLGYWNDEGVAWYSAPEGTGVEVRRGNNPASYPFAHHYTKDAYEFGIMTSQWGWTDEGVAWRSAE